MLRIVWQGLQASQTLRLSMIVDCAHRAGHVFLLMRTTQHNTLSDTGACLLWQLFLLLDHSYVHGEDVGPVLDHNVI
jgi:hypothetical protein